MTMQEKPNHYLQDSEAFYTKVKELIKINPQDYTIVSMDFDNFNYINDLFGYEVGNLVLAKTISHLEKNLCEGEYFTKLHADHYAILSRKLCERGKTATQRFYMIFDSHFLNDALPDYYKLVCSGGTTDIIDKNENLPALLDKANFARKKAKGHYATTFLSYTDKMQDEVKWQKIITVIMKTALDSNEFEMYLQPLTLIKSGQVTGAEALVRWNSKQYGMIYPDKFIPILERSGFVIELDYFMLGEACKFINRCEKEGLPMLPISVNFSKKHVLTTDFVDRVFEIVQKYGVSPKLIELEMTETSMSSDFDIMEKIIIDFRSLGFKVALDDFGSEYSSLNYLKKLPFDVVKIDKEFLNCKKNVDESKVIIAKIIELIKSLRIISVVEGVETPEQVEFLTKLGCDIGQGYVYAKPLTANKYIEYITTNSCALSLSGNIANPIVASYLNTVAKEFQMDNWELYVLGKNIDMGLMKGFLNGDISVQYVNDKALEYIGYNRQEFHDLFNNNITAFTHPDDIPTFKLNTERLIRTGTPVSFNTRAIRKDGKIIFLQGKLSCVMDNLGRAIGLYAFQDVTEELTKKEELQSELKDKIKSLEKMITNERKSREALRISEERYRLIMEMSDDIMFEWDFIKDKIKFSDKYFAVFGSAPLRDSISTNPAVRALLHPDDKVEFENWISETYKKQGVSVGEFRLKHKSGNFIWVKAKSIAITNENGIPVKGIGVFSNVSKQKIEMHELTLKAQLDPLTKIYNKEETRRLIEKFISNNKTAMGAFFIVDIDNFKSVNDNFGHQFGDNVLREVAQKLSELFRKSDIVGRIGGDEFVVFLSDYNCEELVKKKAEAIVESLHANYVGKSEVFDLYVSVGIALYPNQGLSFDELYHRADIALYHAKLEGKNRFSYFNFEMMSIDEPVRERCIENLSSRVLSTYFENDFIYNVFELLYETRDINITIDQILSLTAKRFSVDRAYIFEDSSDGLFTSNTFEWCATGISPEKDSLQNLSITELATFYGTFSEDGISACSDIRKMDETTFEILNRQNIKSFLHCIMHNNEKKSGFIGFDVCADYREWSDSEIAILGYIARVLAIFLNKNRAHHELLESMENYVKMVDNLNGFVYVIDTKSFELLYVNDATHNVGGIEVGLKCYKACFGADVPCKNCPVLHMMVNKTSSCIKEIYSTKINSWVNSAASKLMWGQNKNAALICCTDITKYKN